MHLATGTVSLVRKVAVTECVHVEQFALYQLPIGVGGCVNIAHGRVVRDPFVCEKNAGQRAAVDGICRWRRGHAQRGQQSQVAEKISAIRVAVDPL